MLGIVDRRGARRSAKLGAARLFFHVAEAGVVGIARNWRSRLGTMRAFGLRHRPCDVRPAVDAETAAEIDELRRRYAKAYPGGAEPHPWRHHDPVPRGLVYLLRCRYHLDGVMIARHDPIESAIVDYCGPAQDGDLMAELGAHVVADLTRRQTVRVRAATAHAPMIEALEYIGFVRRRRGSAAWPDADASLAGLFVEEGTP